MCLGLWLVHVLGHAASGVGNGLADQRVHDLYEVLRQVVLDLDAVIRQAVP